MRYSTEWNGHKIEWEFFASRRFTRILISDRVYIDGKEYLYEEKKVRSSKTHKVTFEHEGRQSELELIAINAIIGLLAIIKVDREKIEQKFVPMWRIEKGMSNYVIINAVSFLLSIIMVTVIFYSLFLIKGGFKPVLILPGLDLEEVPGVIYSADTSGNIMAFEPSTETYDTIYSNDSMAVRDISPDAGSILLVHPKGKSSEGAIYRKIYWLTPDDGKMHLLGEWPKRNVYASFTTDGDQAYFKIGGKSVDRSVVVDTFGNVDTFDIALYSPNSAGDKFLVRKTHFGSHFVVDIESGEVTELDPDIVPRVALSRWWSKDTVALWSRRKDMRGSVILVDLNNMESDTLLFPIEARLDPHGTNNDRIVATNHVKKLDLSTRFINRYELYERGQLVWERESYSSSPWMELSPDGDYVLILPYPVIFRNFETREYRIIGEEGTSMKLPIDGRILMWK